CGPATDPLEAGHVGRGGGIAAYSAPPPVLPDVVNFTELVDFLGRNPILSLALAGLTLAIVWTEAGRLMRGFKALRPAQLTGLLNRDNALLVDLSSSSDFEKGHIAGARNIAPSQFDPESKELAD